MNEFLQVLKHNIIKKDCEEKNFLSSAEEVGHVIDWVERFIEYKKIQNKNFSLVKSLESVKNLGNSDNWLGSDPESQSL